MTPIDALGFIAAITTTACFLPQAVRVIRFKDTNAISLWMYILFVVGLAMWLVYGFLLNSLPIILANTFTLGQAAVILYYKATESRRVG